MCIADTWLKHRKNYRTRVRYSIRVHALWLHGCHSRIPMPGERSQYGISILMTDERASQVSHSSWRTKASHNKSRLIPGPWAPPTTKTKHRVLLTKASYYSREPHIATLSIKFCSLTEQWGGAVFLHLIWGNQKCSPFHSPLPTV